MFALSLLVVATNAIAKTGDFWSPMTTNVPVYDGPDKSFPVQLTIGPTDIVRQKSDNKIRGFIKVEIPKYSKAPGYVLEKQLVFLGGTEASDRAAPPANPAPARASDAPTSVQVEPSGSGLAPPLILLLVLLLCGLAYLAYRFRTNIEEHLRTATDRLVALRSRVSFRRASSKSELDSDYEIFKTVADELDARKIDRALWTQALALSEGDTKRQEAIYARLRAERLKEELRKR